jgi:uncharacterized repeat protein (TIGR02543 family)
MKKTTGSEGVKPFSPNIVRIVLLVVITLTSLVATLSVIGLGNPSATATTTTIRTTTSGPSTTKAPTTVRLYAINFSENGGSTVTPIQLPAGATVVEPEDPIRTGYTFAGWYSDPTLVHLYDFGTMPKRSFYLYAKWSINSYTITFDTHDGSAVAPITAHFDATLTAPIVPTKAGFTFNGWFTDAELTHPYAFTVMPATDQTLHAGWTPEP